MIFYYRKRSLWRSAISKLGAALIMLANGDRAVNVIEHYGVFIRR